MGLEEFQAKNRERRDAQFDEIRIDAYSHGMRKTAAALIDAKVEGDKVKELLIKHWDLRPSDAESVITDVKNV